MTPIIGYLTTGPQLADVGQINDFRKQFRDEPEAFLEKGWPLI
jgi:hypothetical protein